MPISVLLPAILLIGFFLALPVVAHAQNHRREVVISLAIWAAFITTVVALFLYWVHEIVVSNPA